MSAGDTQQTQPIPGGWAYAESPSSRPRRKVWPWILGFGIVVGLAIVAWFAGEAIARDIVTKTIRDQVVTQFALPADQEIDVTVPGAMLPQLISGTLGEVVIASDDVPLESFTGDVDVTAHDVPIRGGEMGSAAATVTLDEAQLHELMSTVDGFPADSLSLDAPDIAMSTELSFFGATIPVAVSLSPSAVEGDLVLSPASLQLAGTEITADGLRQQFGGLADVVLRDWTVCLAQYIPAGLTLTTVTVESDQVVAGFDIDGAMISDPDLQENGTCESAS